MTSGVRLDAGNVWRDSGADAAKLRRRGAVGLIRGGLSGLDARERRLLYLNVPFAFGLAAIEFVATVLLVAYLDVAAQRGDMAGRFGWVSDLGVPAGAVTAVVGLTVAFLYLSKSLLGAALHWWQLGIVTRAEARWMQRLYGSFLDASMRFHAGSDSAQVLRDLRMVPTNIVRSILIPAIGLVGDIAVFFVLAGLLVLNDPWVGFVALGYFGAVGMGFVWLFGDRLRRANDEAQSLTSVALGRLQDGIWGVEAIQSNEAEDRYVRRFGDVRFVWAHTRRRAGFLGRAPRFYLEAALVVGLSIICIVLFSVNDTTAALGSLAVMVVVLFRLLPTLTRVLASLNMIRGGEPALRRFEEVAEELAAASPPPADGAAAAVVFRNEIEFRDVVVRYGEVRALDGVSLRIGRGERIAVVGPSGAGKTTLVDVLLGLQTADAGTVSVDGRQLEPALMRSWRTHVAYVPQDVFIIDDTILANITMGEGPQIDYERLWPAVRGAALEELVKELPDGLGQRMGEGGKLLSGGQRQRVGLARALYRQPELLILDEATSALDNESQRDVTAALRRQYPHMTLIIIAHRFNATAACDRVVGLDAGRVTADDSRAVLVERAQRLDA